MKTLNPKNRIHQFIIYVKEEYSMVNNKDKVQEITPMGKDFAQWYTDVILKTELVDYAPIKGFMVIRPYGYAIWEKYQAISNKRYKETGHKNMYFPLLIPESLLE